MNSRLERQSFLGPGSDRVLRTLRIGIVGLGGGGSHIVQQLAHVGVGQFVLLDPDEVESSNLNRLIGATAADAANREPKVRVSSRLIGALSPDATVVAHHARWQEKAESLRDCDVVFGCLDSFVGRDELEKASRRYLTPYIDIGMDVHNSVDGFRITGQAAVSMPGHACLRCMNVLRPDLIEREVAQYGAAGGRPQVVWPNGLLASLAVGLMMQLVTPWHTSHQPVSLFEYDGNSQEVKAGSSLTYLRGKDCPHFSSSDDIGDPWFARP